MDYPTIKLPRRCGLGKVTGRTGPGSSTFQKPVERAELRRRANSGLLDFELARIRIEELSSDAEIEIWILGGLRPVQGTSVLDSTERKTTEQMLQDMEAMFRATFMNGDDAYSITSLEEGRFVDINEAFEKLFGLSLIHI